MLPGDCQAGRPKQTGRPKLQTLFGIDFQQLDPTKTDFPSRSDTALGLWEPLTQKCMLSKPRGGVIQRCILMTTDPGDLVFDPTCGSGTTAFVAEQWGRRWITCDTSRSCSARQATPDDRQFRLLRSRLSEGRCEQWFHL